MEELAAPLVEFLQARQATQTIPPEELPALVDGVCEEVRQRFLEDADVRGGYEILGPADRQEYAELIMGRVRSTLRVALGLA